MSCDCREEGYDIGHADNRFTALQASHDELMRALEGMVRYFGIGSSGCSCGRDDCPVRVAKKALANAAKLNPPKVRNG